MAARVGIHCSVKLTLLVALMSLLMPCLASAQDLVESNVVSEKAPEAVIASAVKAVGELGKSVVQGKYRVAVERMNPKEKARLAKQLGSLKVLEERLEGVSAEMVKQGVRILSCKPQGKPVAYGVEPKMQQGEKGVGGAGQAPSRMHFTQWLVIVPTITRFEVLHRAENQAAKWIEIQSLSYQVAVSDRGKNDWTFIDGAGLSVSHLRNLYMTLPAEIELPKVHKRQVNN